MKDDKPVVSEDAAMSHPDDGSAAESVPPVERRLAAILSADVKDYSRLMGDNDVATVETLTAYREVMTKLIGKHRGRVVDSPGDNLLAEFSSVVAAVECSVGIQEENSPRETRIYRLTVAWRSGSGSTSAKCCRGAGSTETNKHRRPRPGTCRRRRGLSSRCSVCDEISAAKLLSTAVARRAHPQEQRRAGAGVSGAGGLRRAR